MKKIIVLLVSLFCLISPAFAGNLLQQEYEIAKMQKFSSDADLKNYTKATLLENDYIVYLQHGNSIFGELKKAQATLPKNSLDYRYINLAVQQYEMAIKTYNQNIVSMQKIIIDDEDYKKLMQETKSNIGAYNFIAN